MIGQIEKLWIVDESGLVLHHPSNQEGIDHNRFGCLSTIIQTISRYIWNQPVNHLGAHKSHLEIYEHNRFIIIVYYRKKKCTEKIRRFIILLANKLEHIYPAELKGDVKFLSQIKKDLTPKANLLGDFIESQWRSSHYEERKFQQFLDYIQSMSIIPKQDLHIEGYSESVKTLCKELNLAPSQYLHFLRRFYYDYHL